MTKSLVGLQRRMMRLGKVRLGKKGDRGQPEKLSTFRLTSASPTLLEAAAALWGGTVQQWTGAPEEGYYEVTTDTAELPIVIPPIFSADDGTPTLAYSQFYELWSAGGCQRRCDGETESLAGEPCICGDKRGTGPTFCKVTTRVQFMLPDLPSIGVWLLESHGYYAAVELPGTLDFLQRAASEGIYLEATLRAEARSRKVNGQTLRFIVPVIETAVTPRELGVGSAGPAALNMPPVPARGRPELPAVDVPSTDNPPPFEVEAQPVILGEKADELAGELVGLVGELGGDIAEVERRIAANALEHIADPAAHVEWLSGQVARAEKAKEEA